LYYSVGIGGAVLGRGAHVMLIDDPFASMAEALSDVTRKGVGTAYNRLMPTGAIVVISHRMHEDDLAGRLLAQQALAATNCRRSMRKGRCFGRKHIRCKPLSGSGRIPSRDSGRRSQI
jgi:hypothetical protein